jgi:hypothetical protein
MSATPTPQIPICTISYKGDVGEEARRIKAEMEGGAVIIAPPQEIEDPKKRLGAGEIVITIILSAAAKAVLQMVFSRLLKYLVERMEGQPGTDKNLGPGSPVNTEKILHLQIVLKKESQVVGREVLSLKEASANVIVRSVNRLSEIASDHRLE